MKKSFVVFLLMVFVRTFGFGVYAEDLVSGQDPATAEENQPAEEQPAEMTPEEREQAIEELTLLTEGQEALIAQLTTDLENPELTEEERVQKEAELASLQGELENNYEQLADLLEENPVVPVVLTEEEKLALEAKATELETKIAELEAALADQETELTEEERLAMEEELQVLQNELTEVQSTLEAAGSDHPNFLRFQNAQRLGITPGKMHLLEKLQMISGEKEVELELWAAKSVKEINMAVKQERMIQKFGVDEAGNVKVGNKSTAADSAKGSGSKSKGSSGSKSKGGGKGKK